MNRTNNKPKFSLLAKLPIKFTAKQKQLLFSSILLGILSLGALAGLKLVQQNQEKRTKAVIDGDDKAIFAGSLPVHLYDLGVDPDELSNIAATGPTRVAKLRKLLRDHRLRSQALYEAFGPSTETGEVVLSESERERLRAFGYLE